MAPVHIAIIGGGIAGSLLARMLLSQQHVTFEIFDASSETRDMGAAVALTKSALNTLQYIGIERSTLSERTGAVPINEVEVQMVCLRRLRMPTA